MGRDSILVGIDVGTTKIAVVIARIDEDDQPTIIGIGTSPCEGLKRGVVVDLDKTVKALTTAIDEAELKADIKIREAYVGISGDHIRSLNSRGTVAVARVDKTITEKDVQRVIEAAKAIRLPDEREIIHVIPQGFVVDNQDGIKNPVDISGVRLEAEVHIVTGTMTAIRNVTNCVERCGIGIQDIVLQPLASSHAVLTRDEKDLGCALIDIGGGTTDVAVFHEDAIRHSAVIGLGGKNVTTDIAVGLRMPYDKAEQVKLRCGCALRSMVSRDEYIEIPGPGEREPRKASLDELGFIIQPRMEELFTLVKKEIQNHDATLVLGSGIVLTGGASLLRGSAELAEQIFDLPVRIGYPRMFKGGLTDIVTNPAYATSLGLILYGIEGFGMRHQTRGIGGEGGFQQRVDRFIEWLKAFM